MRYFVALIIGTNLFYGRALGSPCDDSTLLSLRKVDSASMSAQEKETLQQKEKDCAAWDESQNKGAPAGTAAQAPDPLPASALPAPTIPPPQSALQGSFNDGVVQGQIAAENTSTSQWNAGSFATGAVCGLIGCGVVAIVARNSDGEVPANALTNYSEDYRSGYRQGYTTEIRRRRTTGAVLWGLVGTSLSIALLYSTGTI